MSIATRTWNLTCLLILGALLWAMDTSCTQAGEPLTWPRFDGPEHNRISRERRMELHWGHARSQQTQTQNNSAEKLPPVKLLPTEESGKPELWEIAGLHGDSVPLLLNDKLYLIHEIPPDSSDLKTLGDSRNPRLFVDSWYISERDPEAKFRYLLPYTGTSQHKPMLVGDSVWRQLFCLLPDGQLLSLDADLGSLLWRISVTDLLEYQGNPIAIAPPLIFEHLLITSLTWKRQDDQVENCLVAWDRRNGQPCWIRKQSSRQPPPTLPALVPCVSQQQILVASQMQAGRIEFHQIRTGHHVASISLPDPQSQATELLHESGHLAILSQMPQSENQTNTTPPADQNPPPAAEPANSNSETTEPPTTPPPPPPPTAWHVTLVNLADPDFSDQANESLDEPRTLQPIQAIALDESSHTTCLLRGPCVYVASQENKLAVYSIEDSEKSREFDLLSAGPHDLQWVDDQLLVTSRDGHWEVFHAPAPRVLDIQEEATTNPATPQTKENSAPTPHSLDDIRLMYAELWSEGLVCAPVVSRQRVYVRVPSRLLALGAFDSQSVVSDLIPSLSDLAREQTTGPPGPINLLPAQQELSAGFQLTWQVFQFSEQGTYQQTLPPETLDWNWEGPGDFDPTTATLTAPLNLKTPQTGTLKVQHNQHSATARVLLKPTRQSPNSPP